MRAPCSILILSDAADLARIGHLLEGGGPAPVAAVSIQIDRLDPNVALSTQKAINMGLSANGWPEAAALSVTLGAIAAACAVGPAGLTGMSLATSVAAVGGLGLVLGGYLGRLHARRRGARAIGLLLRTLSAPRAAAQPLMRRAPALGSSVSL